MRRKKATKPDDQPASEPDTAKSNVVSAIQPAAEPVTKKPAPVTKILLGDALEMLETAWAAPRTVRGVVGFAERRLRKALADGGVRSGPAAREGTWKDPPAYGSAEFWSLARFEWRTSSIIVHAPDNRWARYLHIMAVRESVLKLLPPGYELSPEPLPVPTTAPATQPERLKRGRKPFLWDVFRLRAERLLDIRPDLRNNAGELASELEVWGTNELGPDNTPKIETMRKRAPEWIKSWSSQRD